MEPDTKDYTIWVKSKVWVNSSGMTDQSMKEIFKITIFMIKEFINGLMVEDMRVIGKVTRWMAMVSLPGLMAEDMSVNISKTKSMDTAFSDGLMEENTKATGKMVNNMVMVCMLAIT